MTETIMSKLIEEAPTLGLFVFFAFLVLRYHTHRDNQYLAHIEGRDRVFLDSLKEVRDEMHALADVMRGLVDTIHKQQSSVCNFHEQFQNSLNRIEKSCTPSSSE